MQCTHAPSVQLVLKRSALTFLQCWRHCTALLRCTFGLTVLKTWLLRTWHALWAIVWCMHWRPLVNRRFNQCYWVFLTWLNVHTQLHRCKGRRCIRQPSDAPMVGHQFNRCSWLCISSSKSSRRSFEYFKYLLSLDFYYTLAPLRLIGLVILMVN